MPPKKTPTAPKAIKKDDGVGRISITDLLRVLIGLAILSTGLSYFVTGNSLTWGYPTPWFLSPSKLRAARTGPLALTDAQLARYDGSDPSLPVYVALAGTIYDVSAGRSTYGPGGSYHSLAGRDAARAFVTGCFDTDLHADLRGVEDMYIPMSPQEAEKAGRKVDEKYWKALEGKAEVGSGERKVRRERERRVARKQVEAVLENWKEMFRGGRGKDYFEVGRVVRPEGWPHGEVPVLCRDAVEKRPIRMGP